MGVHTHAARTARDTSWRVSPPRMGEDTHATKGDSLKMPDRPYVNGFSNGYNGRRKSKPEHDEEAELAQCEKNQRELKQEASRQVCFGNETAATTSSADADEGTDRNVCATERPPVKSQEKGNSGARGSALCSEQRVLIGERGAKLMLKLAPLRAKVAHDLVERAKAVDLKEDFYDDRAAGVVKNLLCHLDDEAFHELGFAGWMPFRFPDQWLMFCGVLRRVLAANGLIHSEHAEIYRKLLDETPPVENEARPPNNWSKCWMNRGAESMDALRERIAEEEARGPP